MAIEPNDETADAPGAETGETDSAVTGADIDWDHDGEADADDGDGPTDARDGQPSAVGVKLGSTRTVITQPTDGGVDSVTTLTCMATYEDALTGEEQLLYGGQAATEYPDTVEFMLRSGLPEDAERAELATRFFREVADTNGVDDESVVVYAIPSIDNEAGLRNLEAVIEGSGIGQRTIHSYPESLCGAVPAMGDGLEAVESIFVGINLGSTNLEASAYRRGEQLLHFATGAVTGNEVDRRIANLVEEETQGRVNIDRTTAREYKERHADFEQFEPFTDIIQQPGGGSHEFTIERSVMDAMDEYLDAAVEEIADTFLPEFANDHMKTYTLALDEPVVLTGGMTCIPGLVAEFEARLSAALDREVTVVAPDDPVTAAARGAQRIADRLVEHEAS
jgi:actin-like ATPase involved in cell morphogenesis